MTKHFIAITEPGKEFLFNRSSMIAVPTATAEKIAAALTDASYKIKPGQKWHVYENDFYYNDYISDKISGIRNGKITITHNCYYG